MFSEVCLDWNWFLQLVFVALLAIQESNVWDNCVVILGGSRLSAEESSCTIDDSSACLSWHVHKTEVVLFLQFSELSWDFWGHFKCNTKYCKDGAVYFTYCRSVNEAHDIHLIESSVCIWNMGVYCCYKGHILLMLHSQIGGQETNVFDKWCSALVHSLQHLALWSSLHRIVWGPWHR